MSPHKALSMLIITFFSLTAHAEITHIALVWLSDSAPENAAAVIIAEAASLKNIPGVENLQIGPPEPSDRAVVDDSFSVGISLQFASRESLEAYLIHPIHVDYVTRHIKPYSSRLQVYDIAH